MTLLLRCDTCGREDKAGVKPENVVYAIDCEPGAWKDRTIGDFERGHECGPCTESRTNDLDPVSDEIRKRHNKARDQEMRKAVGDWEAERRATLPSHMRQA